MRQLIPAGNGDDLGDDELRALYQPPAERPWLRVNFVASVDGAVELDGYSRGLGSPADRRVFGLLRRYPDGLLVGAGTLRHEGYGPVKTRNHAGAYPRLIVVSGRLDLSPAQSALADAPTRPAILTSETAPPDRVTALSAVADVFSAGANQVDLAAGLAVLREQGIQQVLCEGGPHLFGSLAAAGLVDEVCLTVSPLLAGAGAGRITAGPPAPPAGLRLRHVLEEDGVLLLRYTRQV